MARWLGPRRIASGPSRRFRSGAALASALATVSSTVVGAVLVVAVAGPAGPAGAAPPPGFTDSFVASVPAPTAVEALPDDRIVVLEQDTGRVRLIDVRTGVLDPVPALDLAVCAGAERGLLGFTHDPDFTANGRVYVYYTLPSSLPGGCHNRVSAFRMTGDRIDPGSEQVLVDLISSVNGNHNGGDLEVGNDGHLYISVGDAGRDPRGDSGSGGANDAARDLSLLNGKLLRVDRFTGLAAPGNPLSGPGTADCRLRGNLPETPRTPCREIFAWGLRNPYRFAFDPNTSDTRFFVNDVGQITREEVNEGIPGADYGWNLCEGSCGLGTVNPIVEYGRDRGTYITAGAFVPDGLWPASYDGGYLFVDGGSGRMWLRDADGDVDLDAPFASVSPGVADMAFVLEPDGLALYYTLNGSNAVRRIDRVLPPPPADSGPLGFVPNPSPERAFDSREVGDGAPLRSGGTRLVDLGAPAGARAALLNVTLVGPRGRNGHTTLWGPRTRPPSTSTVNGPPGEAVANATIAPVDSAGRVVVYQHTTAHLVLDVSGWYVPTSGAVAAGRTVAVPPSRLVDTRQPADTDNAYTRTADGEVDVVRTVVAGRGGVPADGVAAVAVIVTGTQTRGDRRGHATLHATGTPAPTASNVNVAGALDVRANLAVVSVGSGGRIDARLDRLGDVVLDVVGYVTDADAPSATAGRFHLVPPEREVDTRIGLGFERLAAGSQVAVEPEAVPGGASALAQNVTMVRADGRGFTTAFPDGDPPLASNVNTSGPGQVRAALGVVALADGAEQVYTSVGTDLLLDVFGWFE